MIEIVNSTFCAQLNCDLDLLFLAQNLINVEYKPSKFNAIILRIREPKSTCLVFNNGKLVLTGCKSVMQCNKAIRIIARKIQKLGFKVKLSNQCIENLVGSVNYGSNIDLSKLSELIGFQASFEPELFPGLIFRTNKCKVLVFQSGKINITGGKTVEDIYSAFDIIFEYLFKLYLEAL